MGGQPGWNNTPAEDTILIHCTLDVPRKEILRQEIVPMFLGSLELQPVWITIYSTIQTQGMAMFIFFFLLVVLSWFLP